MISEVYNVDCLEGMKQYPDKYFELAIVDPPYGIGINHSIGRRKGDKHSGHKPAIWDNQSPSIDYFGELFRVSKEQIVWGANHFISKMPLDSPCWRTVSITVEDMKIHPKVTKALTKIYCEQSRMYVRINRPFKNFV